MTCLVCDPADPDHIWAGAAGGGVWETTDVGQSWKSLWHDQESLNIGSLAIDPHDPQHILCGTGEANLSADSYAGVGIYSTRDAGASWSLQAPSSTTGLPSRIGAIAFDPFDAQHLFAGGIGFGQHEPSGLYESSDAGATWQKVALVAFGSYWCHSVVFDPVNQGVVYATITEQGAHSGIYRSDDGGQNWSHLTNGLPVPFRIHRSTLTLCAAQPQTIYALLADAWTGGGAVLGVYKTTNGGTSWQAVDGGHFQYERQMSYNNTIAVHPDDPDFVICGGVDLHRSIDGGANWYQVTRWYPKRGSPHYAHADHHGLLIPRQAPQRIYNVNDGGFDVSLDSGRSWHNRSGGLSVTMFYDLDVAQSDGRVYGGGAQDNGTLITVADDPNDFFDITGGDGGWLVFDPNDPGHIYASVYNMQIFRHRQHDGWLQVDPPHANDPALEDEKAAMWMVYIAMDPNDSNTLFTGTHRVWRTQNDGDDWFPVSGDLGSAITAIAIARADSRFIYVGTMNGAIYRSTDGGDTWQGDISSAAIPGVTITRLACKPDNADVVFATVANFDHSHVYRSDNGGDDWIDIDRGELPNAPHHAVVIPRSHPRTVYVASDAGVQVSTDLGATWKDLTLNLPRTNMVDLVYHELDKTLSIATYGRSLWRIRV